MAKSRIKISDLDHMHLLLDRGIDIRNRTITAGVAYLGHSGEEEIDFSFVANFLCGLQVLEQYSVQGASRNLPIIIKLYSFGGNLYHSLSIRDAILSEVSSPVHIHLYGTVASGATVIATAGEKVLISPSAYFVIHYGNREGHFANEPKKSTNFHEHQMDLMRRLEDCYVNQILKNTKGKNAATVRKHIQRDLREEVHYSAEKAIEMGLVHGFLPLAKR